MPNLVTAKVLYNITSGNPLMYSDVSITLNCLELSAFSPRQAWIKTEVAPGDGTALVYVVTSEEPADLTNVIQGWMVVQNSESVIIDAVDLDAILGACNACCDGEYEIAPYYTSGVPAFTVPSFSQFCIERTDDGSSSAFETFNLDYLTFILGGGTVFARSGGVTSYDVLSATTPPAILGDTVTAGACS